MGRPWAVVIGLGIVLCAGLAWLLNFQPAANGLGFAVGAVLIVLGLLVLVMRVGPVASMLDQVGLGQPRTVRERRFSWAFSMAATADAWLAQLVLGPRPGFLSTFAWLAITFTALTVLYLRARRPLVRAAA